MGLALVTDIRVANQDAKYGANFVRLGLHPGMATTYLMPRIMGLPRAVEFLLAGRIVTGREAFEAGLVNHAVPEAEVASKSREIAYEIATAAPVAVRMAKRAIYQGANFDPVPHARLEAHLQSRTVEMEDSKEGIQALLEKRPANFTGR